MNIEENSQNEEWSTYAGRCYSLQIKTNPIAFLSVPAQRNQSTTEQSRQFPCEWFLDFPKTLHRVGE
jgi:hypothetical protein